MIYFQTGDVLYKMTELLPENSLPLKTDLIHKGQNHHHRISGSYELYQSNEDMYILALDTCDLTHEEHATIQLPAGLYKKDLVREYDHFLEESRVVID